MNLNDFGSKTFSQFKEDGITRKIFDLVGVTNKISVEIGVQSGSECCSKILWSTMGFKGLMFDNDHENKAINLHKAHVTIDNVLDLLKSHNVPLEPDFLGIDIDSYDFYVLHTILKVYTPRVLIVETNPFFELRDMVVKLNHKIADSYHGAGLFPWFETLNPRYNLVCHEKTGINAFFVRAGILDSNVIKDYNTTKLFNRCVEMHNYPPHPSSYPVLTGKEALESIGIK
jgi:hypothetical protein